MHSKNLFFSMGLAALCAGAASAGDWPFWGFDVSRNMAAPAQHLPDWFDPGKFIKGGEQIDLSTTKNVKWVAKLGSQAYGNPTVAAGRIYVGTNNESPRDPKHKGDRGILMCLDEKTGNLIWQLAVPKLGAGKVSDWEFLGVCSSPAVEGNRIYVVTNRCEVVCLDTEGLANGNDGPFTEEGKAMTPPGQPALEPGPTDADIIWKFDMKEELGVFPHNIASSSVLIVGDRLYATTSNGQDWSHLNIPSPHAPALVCLDKNTGELLGEEASGISQRLLHCNWSSPAYAEVNGKGMVIFGAGDAYCYAFEPEPVDGPDGYPILKEVWRYGCNPPGRWAKPDGTKFKYPDPNGPSEVIATPVVYKNRVYVSIGQDPEHGDGLGNLSSIDATLTGDISEKGTVWNCDKIRRTISTVSIADGLLFISDYPGHVYCFNADSGELYWSHDTQSHIWGSTMLADGKVYVGNEDGIVTVFKAGKEKEILKEIELDSPVYSTAVAANGVLYIGTQTHLYAISEEKN
jgi:outer membrane protein assembly factor BamB